ncbi:MAG: type III glutamate--ammonia ligase, partial [Bacillota bacterium]
MSAVMIPQPWQVDDETMVKWVAKKEGLKKQGIKFCMTTYVDVHGMVKAKVVPIDHFEKMMRGSELYTGAALDGMPSQEVQSDEVGSRPDLDAIMPVPWMDGMAWCPGSLYYLGKPYEECSRNILKQQTEHASKKGFTFQLGFEPEFFFVRMKDGELVPASTMDQLEKSAYDMPASFDYVPFFSQITEYLQQLGWNPIVWNHEDTN